VVEACTLGIKTSSMPSTSMQFGRQTKKNPLKHFGRLSGMVHFGHAPSCTYDQVALKKLHDRQC
jgi:hypothetical protein